MFSSSDQQIRLAMSILRLFKWPLILVIYAALFRWKPLPTFLFLVFFMLLGAWAYEADQEREKRSLDDFSGGGLFFRYGSQVASVVWAIPVKPEWSREETGSFADSLRLRVAEKVSARLPSDSVQILDSVIIREKNRSLRKPFARVWAKTDLGSLIVHFLHFAAFGRSLTLHYRSFVRGTHTRLDAIKFVVAAPLSVWLWLLPWINNEYSIQSRLANFYISSYDDMDLDTLYSTTHSLLLNGLQEVLEEEGILTEELQQLIFNHITNSNVQQVSVAHSTGPVTVSGSQSMGAPAPRAA